MRPRESCISYLPNIFHKCSEKNIYWVVCVSLSVLGVFVYMALWSYLINNVSWITKLPSSSASNFKLLPGRNTALEDVAYTLT